MQWSNTWSSLEDAVRDVRGISQKFHWVGVYLLNDNVLELGPFIGAPTEHTRIPVGTGVCGTAVAEDRDLNIPDVKAHSNYLACSAETKSEFVALIRHPDGKVVGQIDIDSHEAAAFGPAEETAVKAIAQRLGQVWDELKNPRSNQH